jgi:hypothetical protein
MVVQPVRQHSTSLEEITASFLFLGVSAFGGLAMIEPMRYRVVEAKGWLSQAEFLGGLALCQMVPGATVVQLAVYAGSRLRGLPVTLPAAGKCSRPRHPEPDSPKVIILQAEGPPSSPFNYPTTGQFVLLIPLIQKFLPFSAQKGDDH